MPTEPAGPGAAATAADDRGLRRLSDPAFAWLVTALYAALCGLGIVYHEMWRDEAFTWLILRSASSPGDLVARLGYMGHPKTWYLILYALEKLWPSYWALPLLNLLTGAVAVLLLVRLAPFARHQKLLFALGFYPLFQYGVISRPYGLMVALLFAYCCLRSRAHDRPLLQAAILALLGSLHAVSFLLVTGIVAVELWRRGILRDRPLTGRVWAGLGVVAVSLAVAALQMIPPSSEPLLMPRADLARILFSFSVGFLPDFTRLEDLPFRVVGLLLWLPSWLCFRGRPIGLAYYLVWTAALVALFHGAYLGHRWHYGFYLIGFLSALWLDERRSREGGAATGPAPRLPGPVSRGWRSGYLTLVLAVQAAAGLYALGYDLRYPISSGRMAARFIERHGLGDLTRVGLLIGSHPGDPEEAVGFSFDIDQAQSTIVYLRHPEIYDPLDGHSVRYWKYYTRPHFRFEPISDLVPQLQRIAERTGRKLLLIVVRPPGTATVDLPGELEKLADFPSGIRYGESVSLYRYPAAVGVPERVPPPARGASRG